MLVNRYADNPARRRFWLVAALVAAAALIATLAVPARAGSAAQVLYGADGAGGNPATNLYTLDPATGAVLTTVGPVGFSVTGLAFHPTTGILYATTGGNDATNPGSLIAINQATGAGTLIGDLGAGTAPAADITFGSDGTLYGWWEQTDDLVTIDLLTGAATVVGDSGISTRGSGLAGSGNPLTLLGDDDDGCLSLVDPATGAPTCSATLDGAGGSRMNAADFDAGGTLFAVRQVGTEGSGPTELVTVDPTTGAITVLGATVTGLDAIAFGPAAAEPSVVPSVPDAATSQPITDPTGAALWILGFVLLTGAASVAFRSVSLVRNR